MDQGFEGNRILRECARGVTGTPASDALSVRSSTEQQAAIAAKAERSDGS